MRVTNVDTINYNYDLVRMELLFFDGFIKYKTFQTNTFSLDLNLKTNQLVIQKFEEVHKKYFNESVKNKITIINNILHVNLLTSLRCIWKINSIMEMQNQNEMNKNIESLKILNTNYINVFDNLLQKYCIEIIILFKDSDYEHCLILLLLNLINSLNIDGIDFYENSNIILEKFKQISWEDQKNKKFNHNKIIAILRSDIFCSYYKKLSQIIGDESNTSHEFNRFRNLFFIPSVITKQYFFFPSIDAIFNSVNVVSVKKLLSLAINNLLSHCIASGENSCSNASITYDNISFTNNSIKIKEDSYKLAKLSSSGFNSNM